MYYGSPFYLASLLLALVLTLALWLVLRKCSPQCCRRVLLILSLINLLQHLLKPWIYPHYRGQSFSYISTAYNMCATMILLLPLAFLTKSRYWKNFLFFAGAFAGISALAFPHGAYEVGQTKFVEGSAEEFVREQLRLLNECKNAA